MKGSELEDAYAEYSGSAKPVIAKPKIVGGGAPGESYTKEGRLYRPNGRQPTWELEFKNRFGMTPDEAHQMRKAKPNE